MRQPLRRDLAHDRQQRTEHARRDDFVRPALHLTLVVERRFHHVVRRGPIEVVAHVVFARPDQLDRATHLLRHERCFRHEVGNAAAAKTAAHQRGVYGDLVARDAERVRGQRLRYVRALVRRPDFALAVVERRGRVLRLHRRVREIRHFVHGVEHRRRAFRAPSPHRLRRESCGRLPSPPRPTRRGCRRCRARRADLCPRSRSRGAKPSSHASTCRRRPQRRRSPRRCRPRPAIDAPAPHPTTAMSRRNADCGSGLRRPYPARRHPFRRLRCRCSFPDRRSGAAICRCT